MGLDANFHEAVLALESTNLDLDIAKSEYSSEKNKGKEHKEKLTPSFEATSLLVVAMMTYEMAVKAVEATKLAVATEVAKAFELYENLLSDKSRQPWEEIIKATVT